MTSGVTEGVIIASWSRGGVLVSLEGEGVIEDGPREDPLFESVTNGKSGFSFLEELLLDAFLWSSEDAMVKTCCGSIWAR